VDLDDFSSAYSVGTDGGNRDPRLTFEGRLPEQVMFQTFGSEQTKR
jgi:hypothetical protein